MSEGDKRIAIFVIFAIHMVGLVSSGVIRSDGRGSALRIVGIQMIPYQRAAFVIAALALGAAPIVVEGAALDLVQTVFQRVVVSRRVALFQNGNGGIDIVGGKIRLGSAKIRLGAFCIDLNSRLEGDDGFLIVPLVQIAHTEVVLLLPCALGPTCDQGQKQQAGQKQSGKSLHVLLSSFHNVLGFMAG